MFHFYLRRQPSTNITTSTTYPFKMLNRLKNWLNPLSKINDNLSLYDIFKPIYSVITFLGLFPYSVKFHQNKQKYTIIRKSIYVNSVYAVSVVLTIYVFLMLHIREVLLTSESSSVAEILLAQINYILELIILILYVTVTYVNAFLNRHKYVKILNTIISTWIDISKNYKNSALKKLYFKVFILMQSLFLVVVIQICLNFLQGERLWRMILMFISNNFPQIIQLIMVFFYYVIIMMLATLLSYIEKYITQLKINKENEYKNVGTQPNITFRKIEILYCKAFEAKRNINLVFQYPLLVCTLQCFYGIVNNIIIVYQRLVVERCVTLFEIFNGTFWIIIHLFKIILVVSSGHTLKLKVLEIGQSLYDIPTERQDVHWFMELQHFAAVISYRNFDMELFGCIPLDATLMCNMLYSVSIFVILLIQVDRGE